MIKFLLKKALSETQRQSIRRRLNALRAASEYRKDRSRFLKNSSAVRSPSDEGQLRAHLTMDYHRLEKGMALPSPRVGFGKDVIERLLTNIRVYLSKFGENDLTRTVLGVLQQYRERQAELGHVNADLNAALLEFGDLRSGMPIVCGVIPIAQDALFPTERSTAELFLTSRHSVRQYTGELVSDEITRKIAKLAQRAPSVCNRQCGRLYVANTRDKIDEVLSYQNGNRGFGDTLGGVFIVTADIRAFVSLGERHQGYVDGGIFAMQTLLAIHSQHLGGCMLNWSMTHDRDRNLRDAFGIPDHEIVITMIGFGHCIQTPEIAASPRISIEDVANYL